MSRSAFAARFSALVDEPAMQYLVRARLQTRDRQAAGAVKREIKVEDPEAAAVVLAAPTRGR